MTFEIGGSDMTKVQVSPELQVETKQFLHGLALLDRSEIKAFLGQVDAILLGKNGDSLSAEEKEHITNANLELPDEIHQQYRSLIDKQREQPLTAIEEVMVKALDEHIQDSNATRLKHLRFLSHIGRIPFEELSKKYGLYFNGKDLLFD